MSHKWKVIACLTGLSIASIILFSVIFNATAGVQIAQGTGPNAEQVAPLGWFALLVSGLGALGITGTTLVEGVRTLINTIWPPSSSGQVNSTATKLLAVVSLAEMPLYSQIYNQTSDPAVKSALRATAKLANDAKFEKEFPAAATTI